MTTADDRAPLAKTQGVDYDGRDHNISTRSAVNVVFQIDEEADRKAAAELPPAIRRWCATEAPGPVLYPPIAKAYKEAVAHFGNERIATAALIRHLRQWLRQETFKAYGPHHPSLKEK